MGDPFYLTFDFRKKRIFVLLLTFLPDWYIIDAKPDDTHDLRSFG